VAGRERKRGSCQTRFIVWRDTGASETPVRAASSGVHPDEGAVIMMRSLDLGFSFMSGGNAKNLGLERCDIQWGIFTKHIFRVIAVGPLALALGSLGSTLLRLHQSVSPLPRGSLAAGNKPQCRIQREV